MTNFFDLFARAPADGRPDRPFEELVAASPFRLWRPGDPVTEQGTRLLLGVAPWSGYDMRLLDVMAERMSRHTPPVARVDLFNLDACRSERDIKRYLPGMRQRVLQTPVVEERRDGTVAATKQGYDARELIARMFGSSSAEIVDFVQKWRDARASAGAS